MQEIESMSPPLSIKGVVLAGGKSSRFGSNKALATLPRTVVSSLDLTRESDCNDTILAPPNHKDLTLLDRSIDLLHSVGVDPNVIKNSAQDYPFLTCPVYNDLLPQKGPLGGIYTACSLFSDGFLLVLTCDMPFVTTELLTVLRSQLQSSNQILIFETSQGLQPFPGIYHVSLKDQIYLSLRSDIRSLKSFLSEVAQKKIVLGWKDETVFRNINRQVDLELSRLVEADL